jgi:hypothetical protein
MTLLKSDRTANKHREYEYYQGGSLDYIDYKQCMPSVCGWVLPNRFNDIFLRVYNKFYCYVSEAILGTSRSRHFRVGTKTRILNRNEVEP